ncbi:MAG TPA: response regulator [Candidatus Paceibacterota bacterium]|nr:response regulator [Candidatus Paceibacterota bacterium]
MSDAIPVLLVDDDKFLLDMYAMKFTAEGFAVQACLSAHDAIALLKQGNFAPQAILFDLTMPECDGYDFLQKLSQEKLGAGAMKFALTNQSSDDEKKKALELGADQFLVKATMIPSEVVNTVRTALSKGKSA